MLKNLFWKKLYIHTISRQKMNSVKNPIESTIRRKLKDSLNPSYYEIINESYMHNVPKNSETHFKLIVISNLFQDLPLIKRHRLVNELLKSELENDVHALSIIAKTPLEWDKNNSVPQSPNCQGGYRK